MENNKTFGSRQKTFLLENNVTILFVVLCLVCYFASGTNLSFLLPELFTRIGRNTFMVLALIIPVMAGLGLNFGIVIGAVAAQISIFLTVLWGGSGLTGLLTCVLICTPLSALFGWLVGWLFNSMKGTEMIGGLVTGYFSDGLYQLLFLFILGGMIPIDNNDLMISTGVGVKNTIDLKNNLKYALDDVPMISIIDVAFWGIILITVLRLGYRVVKKQELQLKKTLIPAIVIAAVYAISFVPSISVFLSTPRLLLLHALEWGVLGVVIYNLYRIIRAKLSRDGNDCMIRRILYLVIAAKVYGISWIDSVYKALLAVRLPVLTYLCIGGMCLLIPWFMNTKLGQNMRTVGQNRVVANSAGIDVDRTRILAMILSTILGSYGQLISLQNIGTMATYGAHNQVGLYAIAALLVGGASVQRASTKQAVLGIVLFHTLFILAPVAGKTLFGNAQIGEYFRVFVAYGVIALSLAMHALRMKKSNK